MNIWFVISIVFGAQSPVMNQTSSYLILGKKTYEMHLNQILQVKN